MRTLWRRSLLFLASYVTMIGALWGCVEAFTYFTGERLREVLGLYWPLAFYGLPLLVAAIAVFVIPETGDRQAADRRVDDAREKVRAWGARIAARRGEWDDECWHLLGHALKCASEAIESAPRYQRPWTILADIYHRIGKSDLAKQSLERSFQLATPGPNHPGRFYREVERNIKSGYPYNGSGVLSRQAPPSWFEDKYSQYWSLRD